MQVWLENGKGLQVVFWLLFTVLISVMIIEQGRCQTEPEEITVDISVTFPDPDQPHRAWLTGVASDRPTWANESYWEWDFGDGETGSGIVMDPYGVNTSSHGDHTYLEAGTYEVTATVSFYGTSYLEYDLIVRSMTVTGAITIEVLDTLPTHTPTATPTATLRPTQTQIRTPTPTPSPSPTPTSAPCEVREPLLVFGEEDENFWPDEGTFTPSGNEVLISGSNGAYPPVYELRKYDVSSGELLHIYTSEEMREMCFEGFVLSGDGTRIGCLFYTDVSILDTSTGETIQVINYGEDHAGEIALSYKGDKLLAYNEYESWSYDANDDSVGSAYATLWDVDTGELIRRIEPAPGQSSSPCAAFYSEGERFALAYEHQSGICHVDFYDTESGVVQGGLETSPDHICDCENLVFTPDERFLLLSGWTSTTVWDMETREVVYQLPEEMGDEMTDCSPDARWLLQGHDDDYAELRNLATAELARVFRFRPPAPELFVDSVDFSPNGTTVLINHTLWDVSDIVEPVAVKGWRDY